MSEGNNLINPVSTLQRANNPLDRKKESKKNSVAKKNKAGMLKKSDKQGVDPMSLIEVQESMKK